MHMIYLLYAIQHTCIHTYIHAKKIKNINYKHMYIYVNLCSHNVTEKGREFMLEAF